MKKYRIALVPGNGIQQEIIPENVHTYSTFVAIHGDFRRVFQQFDWGMHCYLVEEP